MWVHWEPGACRVLSEGFLCRYDFVDGPGWVLLECWCQVPELSVMNGSVWVGLWWSLKYWLELCAQDSREVVRRHPSLSSV